MVKEVPSAFFCTLNQEIDLKGSKTIPLVLEIKHQYIDEKCVSKKEEKMTISFAPVARIGKSYALLGEEINAPKIP